MMRDMGTGVGLSVAGLSVKALGGTIEVRNLTGRGAEFTVSLPVRDASGVGPVAVEDAAGAVMETLVRQTSRSWVHWPEPLAASSGSIRPE